MITNKLSKIIGILNRLKNISPHQVLLSIYNAFCLSHMISGILLWGNQVEHLSKLQKKSIRLIIGREYLAHSEPLLKELELLKIEDLYKLKILKFYYSLSYGLLPSYFNCYLDVLNVNMGAVV